MMNVQRIAAHGLTFLVWIALPLAGAAATTTSGLVPDCAGPTCNFKMLIRLVQNVINFLLMIAIPIFAVLFSWAGFLLVTSGGSETQHKKGITIMNTAFIGFIIALGAYLIINTLSKFFIGKTPAQALPVS